MKLQLKKKLKLTKNTYSFIFDSKRGIKWLPGQYFYFTFPNLAANDSRGPTRHFTISSSPTEGDLTITTRIRDASVYKKSLKRLKENDILEVEGPTGTFIIDEKEKGPHILIAGGIGITPFRSHIKYALDKKLDTNFHLIYSCSTPKEIVFFKELQTWNEKYKNIKVDFTISKPEKINTKWNGLKGRIDKNMIKNTANNIKTSTFWICGPPKMVTEMENIVESLNIKSENIRSEKFTGY
jgi:ferredoxin-NADP reductase